MALQYPKYHFQNAQYYRISPEFADIASNATTQGMARDTIMKLLQQYYGKEYNDLNDPYAILDNMRGATELLRREKVWTGERSIPSDSLASLLLMDDRRWKLLHNILHHTPVSYDTMLRIILECARHDPKKTIAMVKSDPCNYTTDSVLEDIIDFIGPPLSHELEHHPGLPALLHAYASTDPNESVIAVRAWIRKLFRNQKINTLGATVSYIQDADAWEDRPKSLQPIYRSEVMDAYRLIATPQEYAAYYTVYGDIAWKYAPCKNHIQQLIQEGFSHIAKWAEYPLQPTPQALQRNVHHAWSYTLVNIEGEKKNIHDWLANNYLAQEWMADRQSTIASPVMVEIWKDLRDQGVLLPVMDGSDINPYRLYGYANTYTQEQLQYIATHASYMILDEKSSYRFDSGHAQHLIPVAKRLPRAWMEGIAKHIWVQPSRRQILYETLILHDKNTTYYDNKLMDELASTSEADKTTRLLQFFASYLDITPSAEEFQAWKNAIHVRESLEQVVNIFQIWENDVRPTVSSNFSLEWNE